jgi:hypothetical protein
MKAAEPVTRGAGERGRRMSQHAVDIEAVRHCGAVVMGACSLLSHDYSGRLQPSIEPIEPGESMKTGWPDPVRPASAIPCHESFNIAAKCIVYPAAT